MLTQKKKILFICTHNSARSQIAEGLMNALLSDRYEAFSAGVEPLWVHPYAVEVMREIDIDISRHYSKRIDELQDVSFDFVVTLCDDAKETCPLFPGGVTPMHKGFKNPSSIQGEGEETLLAFRETRDEIKLWLIKEFGNHEE